MRINNGSGIAAATYCYYQFEGQYSENDLDYYILSLLIGSKIISSYNKIYINQYELIAEAINFLKMNDNRLVTEFTITEYEFICNLMSKVSDNIDKLAIVYNKNVI